MAFNMQLWSAKLYCYRLQTHSLDRSGRWNWLGSLYCEEFIGNTCPGLPVSLLLLGRRQQPHLCKKLLWYTWTMEGLSKRRTNNNSTCLNSYSRPWLSVYLGGQSLHRSRRRGWGRKGNQADVFDLQRSEGHNLRIFREVFSSRVPSFQIGKQRAEVSLENFLWRLRHDLSGQVLMESSAHCRATEYASLGLSRTLSLATSPRIRLENCQVELFVPARLQRQPAPFNPLQRPKRSDTFLGV